MVARRHHPPAPIVRRTPPSVVLAVLLLLAAGSSAGAAPSPSRGTAALAAASGTPPSPDVIAPVLTGIDVIRSFERPEHDWSAGHRGVDLAADVGAPVVSAVDGVVMFAGTVVDRGVVTVQDPRGMRSTVEPVSPVVRTGETVRKGQTIATAVAGHCAERPCVHWGIRVGSGYVDPLDRLRPPLRIVLLPAPANPRGP
ncbi:peptidase family M23 [mine drainage metagenome]|uniref:Peptidase family M23 n=1 Tax=mine drainage metagenome TaxID=410659 RepID=A0A1J5RJX2_9ZZZZ